METTENTDFIIGRKNLWQRFFFFCPPRTKENCMLESKFKRLFKKELVARFPDLEIFEPNPTHRRSSPDMMIFDVMGWAALEFKRAKDASHRPNQEYLVQRLRKKGYATFIYPENKEEVLNDLEGLFSP